MAFEYAIVDLPPVWPGKRARQQRRAPFKTQHARTMKLVARELGLLGARKVQLALELRNGDRDLRLDGMLRADARPGAAVILSFLDRDGHRQAYPCDTFAWWQDNLYAIAVVLEDLRRAERYGVQSALLRAGFKALPTQATTTMDAAAAAEIVGRGTLYTTHELLGNAVIAKEAVRSAIFRTHPDRNNGGRGQYDLVDTARQVLSSHHGVSL